MKGLEIGNHCPSKMKEPGWNKAETRDLTNGNQSAKFHEGIITSHLAVSMIPRVTFLCSVETQNSLYI